MSPAEFHPLLADWFARRFGRPTAPQAAGWREIGSGRDTLIAAPTGSGKTLAAFMWSINRLLERGFAGDLPDRTQVVYISPLKALGNDIERNLQQPLRELRELAATKGLAFPEIRVAVRSGDTPAADRSRMLRHPPHILITTPETLYILLTAEGSRQFLATAETVIVDEIHAVAGDKRGAHLALSLERLDALAGRRLQRIGLSATQKPIDEIGKLLVGGHSRPAGEESVAHGDGSLAPLGMTNPCAIVDVGHRRPMHLTINIPDQELGPIATHELWAEVYERIVAEVQAHRSTLVFVSTRRQAERVAHQLSERLGADKVAAHHGSLSRETRLSAEQRLKSGDLPVVVATASLELGIDIGHVDLVCHVGAPRLLSTLLQRVGRSGHWLGAVPRGILYPLTRDELVQCAAAVRAVRAGELDRVFIPDQPLDILAQQMVATAASQPDVGAGGQGGGQTGGRGDGRTAGRGEGAVQPSPGIHEDDLFALVRRAYPYRDLARPEFDQVLEILAEGIATDRGRRSAHLHWDRVNRVVRPRRGARLAAVTSGGAIPDVADFDVIEEPTGTLVGKVHEDFAVETLAGDIFLLGNQSWRIRRVEAAAGQVRVEDAQGAPPTFPFWKGEAPARTRELSAAVSELREEVAARIADREAGIGWVEAETGLPRAGAEQVVDYIGETLHMLGTVPSQRTVVAERFFDEAGGMQLILHTPFGGRINRAWGLALRKRFCVTFDFELQAAATDDGIVISLGEQHSFPLDGVFSMVRLATLEQDLTQAALQSPVFTNRWRWNASRALALLRYQNGKKVPMNLQRMRAEDLLAAVFPDQIACQDNHVGNAPIQPPDHPLVKETLDNCLREWMDVDGLREILEAIGQGQIRTVAVETPAPSPMSHEILNAQPYAFLDDAPLEERRARAVSLRRTDPDLAAGVGALDPEAIATVRSQAWPDLRDAEELHDLLLSIGVLPAAELGDWREFADQLIAAHRATFAAWQEASAPALVAAERLQMVESACGPLQLDPPVSQPAGIRPVEPDEAVRLIVQGWLEVLGPTTTSALAQHTGLLPGRMESALAALEGKGVALRGRFASEAPRGETEWCERRLLARIHRLTLGRLRQDIEPVSTADFLRFLLRWQRLAPGTQLHGKEGVAAAVHQLQGLELPAPAWEGWALPGRVAQYSPADLEQLCLSGVVAWGRLSRRPTADEADPPNSGSARRRRQSPGRQAPLAFVLREELPLFLGEPDQGSLPTPLDPRGTPSPQPSPRGRGRRDPRLSPWERPGQSAPALGPGEGVPAEEEPLAGLSREARDVADYLSRRGASFLGEIARGTGQVPAAVEDALWELVAHGLATGDGVAGLRALLQPESKRRAVRHLRSIRGGQSSQRLMPLGRWSLWGQPDADPPSEAERNEHFARQLLRRYGVVFRDLLARESQAPPWRVLLRIYRSLEARGQIRGGRFVAGFIGEQYALPEAVEALRAVRRSPSSGEIVLVSCGDPLNLVGVITPGGRISPYSNQVVAYRDGVPVEVGPLGAVRSRLQIAAPKV